MVEIIGFLVLTDRPETLLTTTNIYELRGERGGSRPGNEKLGQQNQIFEMLYLNCGIGTYFLTRYAAERLW